MNIIQNDDTMTFDKEVHRGEIFYLLKGPITDSEQQGGRPVVIVSNEACNMHSRCVTVCCFTTQEKNPLPTHVTYDEENSVAHGTIMAETVQTVAKMRLGSYIGELPERKMRELEKALAIQLNINVKQTQTQPQQVVEKVVKVADTTEVDALKAQLKELECKCLRVEERANVFESLYKELLAK